MELCMPEPITKSKEGHGYQACGEPRTSEPNFLVDMRYRSYKAMMMMMMMMVLGAEDVMK
jgi:hypothetical protein